MLSPEKFPKVLIYDFDGVVCDSVNIKTECFLELYRNQPLNKRKMIRDFHLLHGGVSRFEKIKYFEKVVLGKTEITRERLNELAQEFARSVKNRVVNAPYIPGAYDFIKHFSYKRQFICTGTPQDEINEILFDKKLDQLFEQVFGSPKSKIDIVKEVLELSNCCANDCVYFGDSITDLEAANYHGVPFIGFKSDDVNFPPNVELVTDFIELAELWDLSMIFKNGSK